MSHGPEWNPFTVESGVALGAASPPNVGPRRCRLRTRGRSRPCPHRLTGQRSTAGTALTEFQFTRTLDAGPVHCSLWLYPRPVPLGESPRFDNGYENEDERGEAERER